MKKRAVEAGFTLLEILIVVVVLAAMARISVPIYTNAMEEARSGEAKTALQTIYMAEKIHNINNTQYYPTGGDAAATETVVGTINTALNTDIESVYYDYSVNPAGTGSSTSYVAAATRKNNPSNTYTIDQAGAKTPSGW